MKKTVAVIQSNYIPWKGYFDIVHDADEFIFYDDLQYTKNDWRNRNVIKTAKGTQWLTIPVGSDLKRLICEVSIKDRSWQENHLRLLRQHYSTAPFFCEFESFLSEIYLEHPWENLSTLNQFLIKEISQRFLGIKTVFRDSRDFAPAGKKMERLLDLLGKTGATKYISGPAAKGYIEPEAFNAAGIELIWKDYGDYPEYSQFYPPFTHGVSILDLLFHTGPSAAEFIWGHRSKNHEQTPIDLASAV